MAKVTARLSALGVSRLQKPGLHADGSGLYLQITKAGSRSWLYRYMLHGKARAMGLGPYPAVTLANARDRVLVARNQLSQGVDPISARSTERATAKTAASAAMTFAQCADAYIKAQGEGWKNAKHRQQWRNTLRQYAEPVFGKTPVGDIDTKLVMKVLEPIWAEKTETASRVRGRIENILDWARTKGFRSGENPARWKGNLKHQLAPRSKVKAVEHHPALPYALMKNFMAKLRKENGMAAQALQFTILTASRTGEVRGATWDEIDFVKKVWVIPAARMKGAKEHRVPLSDTAITLLKSRLKLKAGMFVFPGAKADKPLSDMALTETLRRMKHDNVTVHGFRSTFRDWAAEETDYPSEVVEMALSHKVSDDVEAAYRRGDLLKKRIRLMADWAALCGNG